MLAPAPLGGTTLSGTLAITGVTPQQGLPVSLQGPTSSAAITAADGSFVFSGLADGQYTVAAQVRSTLPNLQTQSVAISGGQSVSGVTLSFEPVGIVSGTATLSGGATGTAGITITALGTASSAATDALGRYQLANVPAGSATVQGSVIGGGTATAQVTVVWNEEVVAPDLNLSASQLAATGEISGHATFSSGEDNSEITVTLRGPASSVQVTAADGAFDFTALQTGSYEITASASGTLEGAVSTQVTLGATPLTGISLQLTPIATVVGQVTEKDGTPVPGALVLVNGGTSSAISAIDGSFKLAGAPVGIALFVQASTATEISQLQSVAPLSRGETATAQTLVLGAHGAAALLAGRALQVDGTPAASASIQATGSGLTSITASADSSGDFSFLATEGVYSLEIAAVDGSHENVPVASLAGSNGLVWGGATPAPIGTVELQRAARIGAGQGAAITSRASTYVNPTIRQTDDALFITNYTSTSNGGSLLNKTNVISNGPTGTLWLETNGQAVQMPSAAVYVADDQCSLSTELDTVYPAPVLGPEHTALYSAALEVAAPGPLMVGRSDGTAVKAFGPQVDVGAYPACMASACEQGKSCPPPKCSGTPRAPIASGGDEVVYLGWNSANLDVLENDGYDGDAGTDQLFGFNVNSALGDSVPAPVQLTCYNDQGASPLYVSADGQWVWYSSNGNVAVASTGGFDLDGGCPEPVLLQDSNGDNFNSYMRVIDTSTDGQTVLACVGPYTGSNGQSVCESYLVATPDGTTVKSISTWVDEFTANDGRKYIVFPVGETSLTIAEFSLSANRSAKIMTAKQELCDIKVESDGTGIVATAISDAACASGTTRATMVSAISFNFNAQDVEGAVSAPDGFDCVAAISGSKIAYSDSDTDALIVTDYSTSPSGVSQVLDNGSTGKGVIGCGAGQQSGPNAFIPAGDHVVWFDNLGNNNYTMSIANVSSAAIAGASPQITATLALPQLSDCSAIPNMQLGSEGQEYGANGSPLLGAVSSDGTTASALSCGLLSNSDEASVTLLAADGSKSGTQSANVSLGQSFLLADGTLGFFSVDQDAGVASIWSATLASGSLTIAQLPGGSGGPAIGVVGPGATALVAALIDPTQGTLSGEISSNAQLGTLLYLGKGAAAQVLGTNVLIPENNTNDGCSTQQNGLLSGVLENSADGQYLLFHSNATGSPNQIYEQQENSGTLQTLRYSDGLVQTLLGRSAQATFLPSGAILGVRQDSPEPYSFQDGVYFAAPWEQP